MLKFMLMLKKRVSRNTAWQKWFLGERMYSCRF